MTNRAKLTLILILLLSYFASNGSNLIFDGSELSNEVKLEIFINNSPIGILTKNTCFNIDIGNNNEVIIISQAYNQIDAKYGPPQQLHVEINNERTVLKAKYSATSHFQVFDGKESCVSTIDKSNKILPLSAEGRNKVHFLAPQLQGEIKIKLEINGKTYPYHISKGTELIFTTSLESINIVSTAYNQIDALTGPVFQEKLSFDSDKPLYLNVRLSSDSHLKLIDSDQYEKLKKKIKSIVNLNE